MPSLATKKSPSSTTKSTRSAAPAQVRIIGGQWKRTPLPVITLEGLRPTPDRVRETVFNWLTHLFDGHWQRVHCLDLFAGSGALGFEAASRGAAHVSLVESDARACHQMQSNKEKLKAEQITVLRGDALLQAARLLKMQQQFQLIFVDPPYQSPVYASAMQACASLLSADGFIYLELPA
ncbi:MAG: 16S rRNA (guanine(966)-N(2))-methyltransferase RsmD, partial [Burkholderiales bacterium]|nr:16S rRNA (guanine(966)-N(2))-methyltransferase RsmD [Burkholderiales bacterium]